MKYNSLLSFKEALTLEYSRSTADTYYKAVDFLLADQPLLDIKKMNIDSVISKLEVMKYKNQYSKYKNAFLKLCEYLDIALTDETLLKLERMKSQKIKKRRELKHVKLSDIKNRIRVIRDKKLKLSFQTMLSTGLRVSELSQIKKEDCKISDDCIVLEFVGKGGKEESVLITDKRLIESLTVLMQSTIDGQMVFYSTNYLQSKANERGFSCIDLRRAFAKVTYKNCKDITEVMKLMRHSKIKNTKIYLNSKVKI